MLDAGLRSSIYSYIVRGFSVSIIFLDIQFKYMKDRKNLDTQTDMVSCREYVKLIERFH